MVKLVYKLVSLTKFTTSTSLPLTRLVFASWKRKNGKLRESTREFNNYGYGYGSTIQNFLK